MARSQLVVLGGSGVIIAEDAAATAGTVVMRDASGNVVNNQSSAAEQKSTGILTLTVSASKTATFTADGAATVYRCDATSGAIVATLPAATTCAGRVYWFKKTDSSGNAVTVTGSGSETIDGSNTKALSTQYAKTGIICDGTGWHILV